MTEGKKSPEHPPASEVVPMDREQTIAGIFYYVSQLKALRGWKLKDGMSETSFQKFLTEEASEDELKNILKKLMREASIAHVVDGQSGNYMTGEASEAVARAWHTPGHGMGRVPPYSRGGGGPVYRPSEATVRREGDARSQKEGIMRRLSKKKS